MPLEAIMICVDNSDYTRNGDYTPTRFESQTDAVNLLCGAKTQQNIENSVGIMATAGDRVEVMITPTSDLGQMVSVLPKLSIGGMSDLLRGIQTAQLALKHRQNKTQKQRIIAFVGSPVTATEKELEALGKKLKKNNVSLDLVSFGEVEENTPKLEKLLNAVNSNDSSHLLEVPVGPKLLSDVLIGSKVLNADAEPGATGGGAGGDGFQFGIDPNDDPELALALRISMAEARQEQEQKDGGGAATEPAGAQAAPVDDSGMPAGEDMDEELRQALLLSMQDEQTGESTAPATQASEPAGSSAAVAPAASGGPVLPEGLPEDMDEELKAALLLSMQDDSGPAAAPTSAPEVPVAVKKPEPTATAAKDVEMKEAAPAPVAAADVPVANSESEEAKVDAQWFQDPSFVQELLGSLPGVNINDPRIQSALKEVSTGEKDAVSGSGDAKDKDAKGSGDKDELS
eukprot:TRINITY_DN1401_c0_g1_i5.p1 TRINITY_DN1401_c0_g1~~TRINITY_DN1401_c0_g1_i5.p1  ORF type:complete len:457 (-),score=139.99 TRINITY_DN1401_c0_g1_i5:39-1409(-)